MEIFSLRRGYLLLVSENKMIYLSIIINLMENLRIGSCFS